MRPCQTSSSRSAASCDTYLLARSRSQPLHQTSSRVCITPGAAPGHSCRSRTKQTLTCQPFVCDLDSAQAAPHQPPSHLPSSISLSPSHPHRESQDDHLEAHAQGAFVLPSPPRSLRAPPPVPAFSCPWSSRFAVSSLPYALS
jgi:hypothetical protein